MTSEQFRQARRNLGLTQKGLAKALRMGKHGWQSISKWECGDNPIPGPVTLALEGLLQATVRSAPDCPTVPVAHGEG